MALTVIVTRDVEDRYRGFLSSALLEVAPATYASPHLTPRARDKIWSVLSDWHAQLGQGSICMVYPDANADGGIRIRSLGTPPRRAVRLDGMLLTLRVDPEAGTSAR